MGSSKHFSQAFLQTFLLGLIFISSFPVTHQHNLIDLSTMSPYPALSPDISPLFPTPSHSKATPSPTEPSLPIISSNPSPPDPDGYVYSPEPQTAVSPTGSLPESSAVALSPSGSSMVLTLLLFLLAGKWCFGVNT